MLALASPAAAQEISLPSDLQLGLIAKILTFDRHVERYGPELVIGIAYQPRNRESTRARDDLLRSVSAAGDIRVAGMPLRLADIPLESDRLPDDLAGRVDVMYLAPIRAVDPRVILDQARAMGLLTITASAREASEGTAVALMLRDSRPHIVIDLKAARLAGADLSSRLLRVAEVRQ
jgi:hypothetical protein